jgi:hypothetical protein
VSARAEFDGFLSDGCGATVLVTVDAGAEAAGAEAAVTGGEGDVFAAFVDGSSFVIKTMSQATRTRMMPTATPPRAAKVALPRSFVR